MFSVFEDDGNEKTVMAHQVVRSLYSTVFKQLVSRSCKKSRKHKAMDDKSFNELSKIYDVGSSDDGMVIDLLKDAP